MTAHRISIAGGLAIGDQRKPVIGGKLAVKIDGEVPNASRIVLDVPVDGVVEATITFLPDAIDIEAPGKVFATLAGKRYFLVPADLINVPSPASPVVQEDVSPERARMEAETAIVAHLATPLVPSVGFRDVDEDGYVNP